MQKTVICLTNLCHADIKIDKNKIWKSNKWCKYLDIMCPTCHMLYWLVNRNNKYILQSRKKEEEFDNRSLRKELR